MNYVSVLFIILGFLTILIGLFISKGNGDFVKPYNVEKKSTNIKSIGKITMIIGIIIFMISLITYIL